MRTGAIILALLVCFPVLCWGQPPAPGAPPDASQSGSPPAQPAAPAAAPQPVPPMATPGESAPAGPGSVRTDIFGRPVLTETARMDYLNRFFWPPLDFATEGFHLAAAVKEEYSSNLNLTDTNRLDDFITTVSPGLRYLKTNGPAGVDLTYVPGYNIYAKHDDLNYWSHFGALNTYYSPTSRWTLRLRDVLVRTDDPLEYDPLGPVDQYFLSTTTERTPHLRNIAEPQVQYRFGADNYFSVLYRNMYYKVDAGNTVDTENSINPRLMYWFNVHNGIVLDYSYSIAELESSPDWAGNDIRARYIYRFNPGTSIYGEYYYASRGFDPPSASYKIHQPSVGVDHAFSPTLSASLQLGYYVKDPEFGEDESSFSGNLFVRKRTELTTYILNLIWGFREEYLTPENLGFIEYRRAEANIIRALSPRLSFSIKGTVEWAEYETGRRDWIYGACAGLSWSIYKWLTLTPTFWYREQNSNTETFDYQEFRGILRLTATY